MKLVLPSLVEGVDSRTWRSKQGSVQMLGAMAYCAPKQLGTALPSIVPKLSEILADPHPKVQSAARQALKEVSFQTSSLQLGMRRKFLPCMACLYVLPLVMISCHVVMSVGRRTSGHQHMPACVPLHQFAFQERCVCCRWAL